MTRPTRQRPTVTASSIAVGLWREIANTDSRFYGGSDLGNDGGAHTIDQPSHGEAQSVLLTLPPLATVMLRAQG